MIPQYPKSLHLLTSNLSLLYPYLTFPFLCLILSCLSLLLSFFSLILFLYFRPCLSFGLFLYLLFSAVLLPYLSSPREFPVYAKYLCLLPVCSVYTLVCPWPKRAASAAASYPSCSPGGPGGPGGPGLPGCPCRPSSPGDPRCPGGPGRPGVPGLPSRPAVPVKKIAINLVTVFISHFTIWL